MTAFETIEVDTLEVRCEGEGGPLGHPRVYLHIERDTGAITCPYCSRSFVFRPGAAKTAHG